jgi:uncharacterized protein YcfJ
VPRLALSPPKPFQSKNCSTPSAQTCVKNLKSWNFIFFSVEVTTSCASLKPSHIIGASIGATVGGLAGTVIGDFDEHPVRGALIGATAGAAMGGLAGVLYENSKQKKEKEESAHFESKTGDLGLPPVSKPEVHCVEVPDKIEDSGKKLVKKHAVCTINRGSVWMME